ncbi:MAG: gliding motility-associated C-terminal domain-containing protein [Bacteroidia bacterium]|nr:gliding motility-associated C-terminal domain-containing protein [Bacteroidia bacterium]
MKKLLILSSLFFSFIIGFAQPANDDCSTAQAIGNLPTPAACPSGVGAAINIAGSLTTATAPNPYLFMNNCSGTSASMASPANDVWYTFVATGYQLQLNITGTVANPNVAMYSGTCGLLGGGVGGCTVGTAGGNATLIVNQMVPGTTYYIQVSSNAAGAGGNFNMAISNSMDCNNCMIGSVLTPNPLPVNGMYTPGQVVNFCFTINNYTQINTNWLHGVQVAFGSGWSGISGQVGATPVGGSGAWTWFNSCTSTATGATFGQGFYIDLDADGNPGNNFGDNCDPFGTGIPCPPGTNTWTFCFTLTAANACNPGSNLSVTINTSGDGESGSWSNAGCAGDPATIFNAMGSCCPPIMAQVAATCAGNDGQASATPVGVVSPYDWTWAGPAGYSNVTNNVAGGSTITNLTPGTYTVSVIDANGCLVTNTVTVTGGGATPAPVAGSNSPVCVGSAINLTCTNVAGATYSWTGPNAYVSGVQNPTIAGATVGMSGNYVVTANVGGCIGTSTVTVTVNPAPVPVANNTGPYCAGDPINLSSTPNGATSYAWSGPSAYANGTQNPTIAVSTVAMSGVYTVTVSIGTCSATATTNVVVNPLPVPNPGSSAPVCLNQAINFTANNGFTTYAWTGPNGFLSGIQNPTISPATAVNAGTYSLTVTDGNGCTAQGTTVVIVNALPVVVANNNGPLCPNTQLNLTSTNGMVSYSWTGPNGFNSAVQNPSIPSVILADAGTYTVTVTDANGCVNAALTTLVINGSLAVVAGSNSPVCETQALNLTSGGATNYSWAGPNAFASALQNPSIAGATIAASGTYTVTGTDALGCTGTATVTVVVNTNPIPVANNNGPLCAGSNLNLTGNGGPSYTWTGPNAFNSAVQNPPILGVTTAATGIYTLSITNAAGCTATVTTNVTINPIPVLVVNSNSPVCNNGTINITANGGTAYAWTGPNGYISAVQNPSIPNAVQNMSGVYTVIATGVGTCTATANVNVLVYPPVSIVAGADVTICAGLNANLTSVPAGGDGSYTYLWTPGGAITNNTTVSPAITTTYTVTVTSCGENATDNVIVTVNPTPVLSITPDTTSGCAPLCVTFTGASVPASVDCDWVFSNGQISNNNCVTQICFPNAGQYGADLTVTDINGCTNTLSAPNIITVFPVPTAAFSSTPTPADIFDPTIYFTDLSYGATITNWTWNFGDPLSNTSAQQNPSFNYGNAGIYTVTLTVTSVDGCVDDVYSTVVVEPNFSLYVPNAFTPNADGVNDVFFAKGEGIDLDNWDLWIYDRWGNMIFYTDDFFKAWDGKVQGKSDNLVQIDVYVWKIKCRNFKGEKKSLVGHVTVVR